MGNLSLCSHHQNDIHHRLQLSPSPCLFSIKTFAYCKNHKIDVVVVSCERSQKHSAITQMCSLSIVECNFVVHTWTWFFEWIVIVRKNLTRIDLILQQHSFRMIQLELFTLTPHASYTTLIRNTCHLFSQYCWLILHCKSGEKVVSEVVIVCHVRDSLVNEFPQCLKE